jgi:type VI secretion system protein ImpM
MTSGFYGKMACRGDFVSRGLPQSFIQPWDAWLTAGLLASQQDLGAQWLEAYLVSPLWRFALARGVCGPDAVAGVLMPSIDRVGRYFPLTIAQCLPADQSVGAVVSGPDAWFEQAESLLLSTLDEGADFERFDSGLLALDTLPTSVRSHVSTFAGLQRIAASQAEARSTALVEKACEHSSLWWGKGSQRIAPGLLHCTGLPAAVHFGSFLLGQGATT